MLKLIYTETSLHLELFATNLADWIDRRFHFAKSIGEPISVGEQKAAFSLPDLICDPTTINFHLHRERVTSVTVSRCDLDRVEIELNGYWLSTHLDSVEGIFVTQLPTTVESYLWELWQRGNNRSIAGDGVVG
jgi:hypothetical protein